ncbi:hypothetical protein QJQ45_029809, partial [Haematococcus lacustris]
FPSGCLPDDGICSPLAPPLTPRRCIGLKYMNVLLPVSKSDRGSNADSAALWDEAQLELASAYAPQLVPDEEVPDSARRREQLQGPLFSLGDYECAICTEVLLDPVVGKESLRSICGTSKNAYCPAGACGHEFCRRCLEQWRQVASSVGPTCCPICRTRLPTTLGTQALIRSKQLLALQARVLPDLASIIEQANPTDAVSVPHPAAARTTSLHPPPPATTPESLNTSTAGTARQALPLGSAAPQPTLQVSQPAQLHRHPGVVASMPCPLPPSRPLAPAVAPTLSMLTSLSGPISLTAQGLGPAMSQSQESAMPAMRASHESEPGGSGCTPRLGSSTDCQPGPSAAAGPSAPLPGLPLGCDWLPRHTQAGTPWAASPAPPQVQLRNASKQGAWQGGPPACPSHSLAAQMPSPAQQQQQLESTSLLDEPLTPRAGGQFAARAAERFFGVLTPTASPMVSGSARQVEAAAAAAQGSASPALPAPGPAAPPQVQQEAVQPGCLEAVDPMISSPSCLTHDRLRAQLGAAPPGAVPMDAALARPSVETYTAQAVLAVSRLLTLPPGPPAAAAAATQPKPLLPAISPIPPPYPLHPTSSTPTSPYPHPGCQPLPSLSSSDRQEAAAPYLAEHPPGKATPRWCQAERRPISRCLFPSASHPPTTLLLPCSPHSATAQPPSSTRQQAEGRATGQATLGGQATESEAGPQPQPQPQPQPAMEGTCADPPASGCQQVPWASRLTTASEASPSPSDVLLLGCGAPALASIRAPPPSPHQLHSRQANAEATAQHHSPATFTTPGPPSALMRAHSASAALQLGRAWTHAMPLGHHQAQPRSAQAQTQAQTQTQTQRAPARPPAALLGPSWFPQPPGPTLPLSNRHPGPGSHPASASILSLAPGGTGASWPQPAAHPTSYTPFWPSPAPCFNEALDRVHAQSAVYARHQQGSPYALPLQLAAAVRQAWPEAGGQATPPATTPAMSPTPTAQPDAPQGHDAPGCPASMSPSVAETAAAGLCTTPGHRTSQPTGPLACTPAPSAATHPDYSGDQGDPADCHKAVAGKRVQGWDHAPACCAPAASPSAPCPPHSSAVSSSTPFANVVASSSSSTLSAPPLACPEVGTAEEAESTQAGPTQVAESPCPAAQALPCAATGGTACPSTPMAGLAGSGRTTPETPCPSPFTLSVPGAAAEQLATRSTLHGAPTPPSPQTQPQPSHHLGTPHLLSSPPLAPAQPLASYSSLPLPSHVRTSSFSTAAAGQTGQTWQPASMLECSPGEPGSSSSSHSRPLLTAASLQAWQTSPGGQPGGLSLPHSHPSWAHSLLLRQCSAPQWVEAAHTSPSSPSPAWVPAHLLAHNPQSRWPLAAAAPPLPPQPPSAPTGPIPSAVASAVAAASTPTLANLATRSAWAQYVQQQQNARMARAEAVAAQAEAAAVRAEVGELQAQGQLERVLAEQQLSQSIAQQQHQLMWQQQQQQQQHVEEQQQQQQVRRQPAQPSSSLQSPPPSHLPQQQAPPMAGAGAGPSLLRLEEGRLRGAPQPWHDTAADQALRSACSSAVAATFVAHFAQQLGHSHPRAAIAKYIKAIEQELYFTAASRQEYADLTTLHDRAVQFLTAAAE